MERSSYVNTHALSKNGCQSEFNIDQPEINVQGRKGWKEKRKKKREWKELERRNELDNGLRFYRSRKIRTNGENEQQSLLDLDSILINTVQLSLYFEK